MYIEFKGFTVTKLNDRYHVINRDESIEFIVDSIDEAMLVINGECNA